MDSTPGYAQFEYIDSGLPDVLALAAVVVSRAGATAVLELAALRKPMVLVPLPRSSSRGDQILNAAALARRGLCDAVADEDLTPDGLVRHVLRAYERRQALERALRSAAFFNGSERVIAVIQASLTKKPPHTP